MTENTPRVPLDGEAYYVDLPWTWRERLRFKLFPSQHCALPQAPAEWKDCVVCTTIVGLSLLDRVRVLISGRLRVQTRTVTEHRVGGTMTESVAYPIWK